MSAPAPVNHATALSHLRDVVSDTAASLRAVAKVEFNELGEDGEFGLYLILNRLADDLQAAEAAATPADTLEAEPEAAPT